MSFSKILIIQTAFLGDVVLATALIEKLYQYYPKTRIDFLLRKGNETLLIAHPKITKLYIWNKQNDKTKNLYNILQEVRIEKYDLVINLQRFFSSGIFASFSGAKQIIGFQNNPLSFMFTNKYKHEIGNGTHEVVRNQNLIANITDNNLTKPKLYPTNEQIEKIKVYQNSTYICIAPSSVWYTKQYPVEKWVDLIKKLPENIKVYLLGSPADNDICNKIIAMSSNSMQNKVENLCGKVNLLESAALMQGAMMNYVNDSAPLHLASAVNAPVCAVFCSTIPEFGFTPLSEKSFIVQTNEKLSCRPCGLHGYKECPEKHFNCANNIETNQLLEIIN